MTTCSICMNTVKRTRSSRELDCGHIFHGECLYKWQSRSPTCPICRKQFADNKPKYKVTLSIENTYTQEQMNVSDPNPTRIFEIFEQLELPSDMGASIQFDIDNLDDLENLLADLGVTVID